MYIQLTKTNFKKHKIGDIIKVKKAIGDYLIKSKVAIEIEEEKKETKDGK